MSTYLGGILPVNYTYKDEHPLFDKYIVFVNDYLDDRAIMKFGDRVYHDFFKE